MLQCLLLHHWDGSYLLIHSERTIFTVWRKSVRERSTYWSPCLCTCFASFYLFNLHTKTWLSYFFPMNEGRSWSSRESMPPWQSAGDPEAYTTQSNTSLPTEFLNTYSVPRLSRKRVEGWCPNKGGCWFRRFGENRMCISKSLPARGTSDPGMWTLQIAKI